MTVDGPGRQNGLQKEKPPADGGLSYSAGPTGGLERRPHDAAGHYVVAREGKARGRAQDAPAEDAGGQASRAAARTHAARTHAVRTQEAAANGPDAGSGGAPEGAAAKAAAPARLVVGPGAVPAGAEGGLEGGGARQAPGGSVRGGLMAAAGLLAGKAAQASHSGLGDKDDEAEPLEKGKAALQQADRARVRHMAGRKGPGKAKRAAQRRAEKRLGAEKWSKGSAAKRAQKAQKRARKKARKTARPTGARLGWLYRLLGGGTAVAALLVAVVFFLVLVTSLGASQRPAGPGLDGVPDYITSEMIEAALDAQELYGHPAGATIAQIIAESGQGDHLSGLATQDHNLFGMKYAPSQLAHPEVSGHRDYETGEQNADGTYTTVTASFTSFVGDRECIIFRSRVFLQYSNYAGNALIQQAIAERSSDRMAEGLKDAGWATSISYVQTLKRILSEYDLYRLDHMTADDYRRAAQGAGPGSQAGGGVLGNPCPAGTVTSGFGMRDGAMHNGTDFGAPEGTPYYAAEAGVVVNATYDGGWNGGAGNWVVIDHGGGLKTVYMHSSKVYVSVGQRVERGQNIGAVGNTGDSYGAHLHFEVRVNGAAVDPLGYL